MPMNAFTLLRPTELTSSVVFASPHSGRDYPDHFVRRSLLDAQTIRSSEDAFVDRLFKAAPQFGAPFLTAEAPRAFIDLNRGVDELDPALISGVRRYAHNPRVASGLGVIPRVVSNGRAIYRGKLPLQEAKDRIATYWHPYHAALKGLLNEAHTDFGEAILVDCHSMPHEALDSLAKPGTRRPVIVIGDRFGSSADGEIVDQIEAGFAAAGLNVARNSPFAGAYVAQHYGRPSRRQHAIQIEIDRSLYMDERTVSPHSEFAAFQELLTGIIAEIAAIGTTRKQLAAE